MNHLHTNAVSRTAPRYNNNPVLPYKLHDNHTSRRSSFSSFADSETSEVSVFSQVSTISSISSVSSSGPTHATWQPRLNDAIPCAGYSGSSSHGITDTTRPRGISSFLNLGSYHEETDWAGVQLRSTLPTEDVRSTAAGPFQYYSANHSTNPRRSVTSQTWQKPSLVRQNDKRQILVEQLVDSATQLVAVIWPSAVTCSGAASGAASEATNSTAISLRTFIRETLRRSRTSHSTLQVTLYYLVLIQLRAGHLLAQLSAHRSTNSNSLACGRRMFLAALILASKYLQDRNYSARAWTKISGLCNQEISSNEIAFLLAVDWELHVRLDVFQQWTDIVHQCTSMLDSRPPHQSAWATVVCSLQRGSNFDCIRSALLPARFYKLPYPSPQNSISEFDIDPRLRHEASVAQLHSVRQSVSSTKLDACVYSPPRITIEIPAYSVAILSPSLGNPPLRPPIGSSTLATRRGKFDIDVEKTKNLHFRPDNTCTAPFRLDKTPSHHATLSSVSPPSFTNDFVAAPSPLEDAPCTELQIRGNCVPGAPSHLPSPPTSDVSTSPEQIAPPVAPQIASHIWPNRFPSCTTSTATTIPIIERTIKSLSSSSSCLFDPSDFVYSPESYSTPVVSDLRTRLIAPQRCVPTPCDLAKTSGSKRSRAVISDEEESCYKRIAGLRSTEENVK